MLLSFLAVRVVAVALHELSHGAVALACGLQPTVHLGLAPFSVSCTTVPGACTLGAATVIRHSGWLLSVVLALSATRLCLTTGSLGIAALAALWLTALDAVCSDALGWSPREGKGGAPFHGCSTVEAFYCGNFGLLLLDAAHSDKVREIITKMIRITMMRGAQSAGIITYHTTPDGQRSLGRRYRVVNSKRTDLCDLLMKKCGSATSARHISAPQVFQGHTRFATSSIASLEGCHPHRWTPVQMCVHWRHEASADRWVSGVASVENYITHNGDLDFYELHGVTYPLSDVQKLLPGFLHQPCIAEVDSYCIAGLVDLMRTSGVWRLSVRYGYIFGGLAEAGNLMAMRDKLWNAAELAQVSAVFESAWAELLEERGARAAAMCNPQSKLVQTLEQLFAPRRASDGDKEAQADRWATMSEAGRSLMDAMVSSMLDGRGARRLAGVKHRLVRAPAPRIASCSRVSRRRV
jgi:hypothetical protein